MNTNHFRLTSLAIAALLTSAGWAQEPGVMTPAAEDATGRSLPGAPTSPPVAAAKEGEDVGISRLDGYTISGAEVIVTRNGVSEKLTKKSTLGDGSIISPNGMIKLSNGTELTLRADQVLSADGKLMAAPVAVNQLPASVTTPPKAVMSTPSTAGNAMTGAATAGGKGGPLMRQEGGGSGSVVLDGTGSDFASGRVNSDGSITNSDGSVLRADGTVQQPDGSVTNPNPATGQNSSQTGNTVNGRTTQTNNGVTTGRSNTSQGTSGSANNGNTNPGVPANGSTTTGGTRSGTSNSNAGGSNSTGGNSGGSRTSGANSGGSSSTGGSNGSAGSASGGGASGAGGASGGGAGGGR